MAKGNRPDLLAPSHTSDLILPADLITPTASTVVSTLPKLEKSLSDRLWLPFLSIVCVRHAEGIVGWLLSIICSGHALDITALLLYMNRVWRIADITVVLQSPPLSTSSCYAPTDGCCTGLGWITQNRICYKRCSAPVMGSSKRGITVGGPSM